MEKAREYGNDIYICFIDCVDHTGLWLVMRRMGIPEHIIVLIKTCTLSKRLLFEQNLGIPNGFQLEKECVEAAF